MELQLSQQMIEAVDARVEIPSATYTRVLTAIKTALPDLTHNDLIQFSTHFLAFSFEKGTDYHRMANALLANVYYLHYVSEIQNGLQHPSGVSSSGGGLVEDATTEQATTNPHSDNGPSGASVQSEPSSEVSGDSENPPV